MTTLLTRPTVRRMREGDIPPWGDETREPRTDETRPQRGDEIGQTLDGLTGPTLDDVISRAWEVLRADVPAACPACGAELVPRASAGAGIVGGRCESCGTSLS
jgi:hypothetical protein